MKTALKTKRLRLRPMTDEELAARMERTEDAHDKRAYGEMLSGSRAHPAERAWYTAWEIALHDGTAIGDACFKGAPANAETELGYGLDEPYRGQGYATEAVEALCAWAFGASSELYFLLAETAPDNAASQRVLIKNGFVPAGEGKEGPRFEKERPESAWMATYIGVGMGLGVAFGTATDNLALGLAIGSALGIALGTSLDAKDKKKREALRAARKAKAGETERPANGQDE